MRLHGVVALSLVSALSACGGAHVGDDDDDVDASQESFDALIDSPDGIVPLTCDYQEAADGTNTTISNAEGTGKTLGSRLTICGKVNTGHFDAGNQIVDADGFSFSVATTTDVLVHLIGTGVTVPDQMILEVAQGTTFYGFGTVEGDHGTLMAHLPAGTYVAAVAAFNGADLASVGDYQITIVPDLAVASRCQKATGAANYTEHLDGASNSDNDVIDYNSTSNTPSSLSASTSDTAESTGLTVTTDSNAHPRITGSSAAVDPADDYEDRDTFSFTTGPTTTQMTVRLNWASTSMDLDYRIYPFTTTTPRSIAGGLDQSLVEEEVETFAVKPNTLYWLWVAAEDGATGQPSAYDATLCGAQFAP